MPRFQTHYDNLKVSRDAPTEVIRAAYKTLAAKYHPDLSKDSGNAARIMRIINASYEVLSDSEKRRQHDLWIAKRDADGLGSDRRHSKPADEPSADEAASGMDLFERLCRSIRLECWQHIQGDEASREPNNEVLKQAYAKYNSHVRPWLSAMVSAYGFDADVLATARDAAARCLLSISGGFQCVDNLDDAEKLADEALALVTHGTVLDAEVLRHIREIKSERSKLKSDFGSRLADKYQWLVRAVIYVPLLSLIVIVPFASHFDPKRRALPVSQSGNGTKAPTLEEQIPNADPGLILRTVPAPIFKAVPVQRTGATTGYPVTDLDRSSPAATRSTDAGPKPDDPCEVSITGLERTRLANGTEPGATTAGDGLGVLEITNGNSEDAAVILSDVEGLRDDRLMYIRSGRQATMRSISPGRYRIMFQTGKSWDDNAESFRCAYGTSVFDKTESFTEQESADAVEYARIRVTLHRVVGGNARISPLANRPSFEGVFPGEPFGRIILIQLTLGERCGAEAV